MIISRSVLSEWEIIHTKVVEEIKTRILFNFFSSENLVVYYLMWKNRVQSDWPHTTIRSMRFACWITKATDTHTQVLARTAFPRLRERLNIICNVHCQPRKNLTRVCHEPNCDAMGPTFQYSVLVLEHQILRHYKIRIRLSSSESGDPIQ